MRKEEPIEGCAGVYMTRTTSKAGCTCSCSNAEMPQFPPRNVPHGGIFWTKTTPVTRSASTNHGTHMLNAVGNNSREFWLTVQS
jgi:hypothetical protein